VYAPAMHARPVEIQALAKVVARRGGDYATHMRSEGGTLLEAIDEAWTSRAPAVCACRFRT
jgi:N-acyl-D-aspartate/D-glutamate deacylase